MLNAFAILPIDESAFFAALEILDNVKLAPTPSAGKPLYSSGGTESTNSFTKPNTFLIPSNPFLIFGTENSSIVSITGPIFSKSPITNLTPSLIFSNIFLSFLYFLHFVKTSLC